MSQPQTIPQPQPQQTTQAPESQTPPQPGPRPGAEAAPALAFETTVVEHRGHRIARVLLRPASGLVVWSPEALAALADWTRDVDTSGVDAIAFAAAGRVFGAGADLSGFRDIAERDAAREAAAAGYRALAGVSALPVPTFALIGGAALGGGLEFALRCDRRIARADVEGLGLPEVGLGLVPGWGGIPAAVAVIGPEATGRLAVLDALSGRGVDATTARTIGLVDDLVDDLDGVETLDRIVDALEAAPVRLEPEGAGEAWTPDALLARVRRRIPTPPPAVDRAVALIAQAARHPDPAFRSAQARIAQAGTPQPLEAETIDAFVDLLMTDESRAAIHAFFALQQARRRARPSGAQRRVDAVGVMGGGLMATQLAVLFATRLEVPVRVVELDADRVEQARARIAGLLDRAEAHGDLDAAARERIAGLLTVHADVTAVHGADVVIEAVYEDLDVKRAMWAEVEPHVADDALLLTNTSSLPVAAQGTALQHPERLIGFHFFNPVAVLPLVELIVPETADRGLADTALELGRRLGKAIVRTGDRPGFLVNRLLSRLFAEALELVDAGWDPLLVDRCLVRDGLPMTMFTLLDHIGHPVQLHVLETLHEVWPERFPVSTSLRLLVERTPAGSRSRWLDDSGRLTAAARDAIAVAVAERPAHDPACDTAEAARLHILRGVADEAALMLADGTVTEPGDIDAAMILGANHPRHNGGLLPLLDRSGASRRAPRGRELLPDGEANVPGDRHDDLPALAAYDVLRPLDLDFYGVFDDVPAEDRSWHERARRFTDSIADEVDTAWDHAEYPLVWARRLGALDLLTDGVTGPGLTPMSPLAAGLVGMEMHRCDGSVGTVVAVQGGLALRSIAMFGSPEQQREWLVPLARGERLGAFALTEPEHGSDAVALTTTARRDGDGWVITGRKKWIGNGSVGDVTVTWARDEEGRVRGFLVPQTAPGYIAETIRGKGSLRSIHQALITYDHVRLPADAVLPGARSFKDTARVLAATRLGIAWAAVGHAQAVTEIAVQYARQRHQFGRAIGDTQLVQERLAEMLSILTSLQLHVRTLAERDAAGTMRPEQASLAKVTATRGARRIAQLGRDMLGGNGILLEYGVMRHFADIEALHTYEGTESVQSLIVGRDLTGHSAFSGR